MTIITREKIYEKNVKELMTKEKNLDFPDFLRALRKALGYSRQDVKCCVGINIQRLFNIEHGIYSKAPHMNYLLCLAKLYGVDSEFLRKKLQKYLQSNPQYEKSAEDILSYMEIRRCLERI